MNSLRGKMLTPRECEVLELVVDGHNNESIGNQLDITRDTVRRHLAVLYAKRGVNSKLELAVGELKEKHARELGKALGKGEDQCSSSTRPN